MNTTMENGYLQRGWFSGNLFRVWATRLASIAGIAVFLGLAGCSSTNMDSLPPQASVPQYRLGPGDRLSVVVFGEDTMTGEYDVDDTGTLSIPLAGRVNVTNMTPAEVEKSLDTKLGHGLIANPQVAVSVVRYRPFFILGEVKNPGAYPYYGGATVLSAVAMAGGYTYRAQTQSIEVVRSTSADRSPKVASQEAYLEPGDVVIVPLRWF